MTFRFCMSPLQANAFTCKFLCAAVHGATDKKEQRFCRHLWNSVPAFWLNTGNCVGLSARSAINVDKTIALHHRQDIH